MRTLTSAHLDEEEEPSKPRSRLAEEVAADQWLDIAQRRTHIRRWRHHDDFGFLPYCAACGDTATVEYGSRWLCRECALELKFGIVIYKPMHFDATGPGCPLEPNDDDPSPGDENCVRALEDNDSIPVPFDSSQPDRFCIPGY